MKNKEILIREVFAKALFCSEKKEILEINKGNYLSQQIRNSERSKVWVMCLSEALLELSREKDISNSYLAFYRENIRNRQIFGLNEFLFDIVIAQTMEFNTASGYRNSKAECEKLIAIKKASWIVESEFGRCDSRSLLLDMNKLVIVNADHKLFVISSCSERLQNWVIQTLSDLMMEDDAEVYLAIIPHPDNWFEKENLQVIRIK